MKWLRLAALVAPLAALAQDPGPEELVRRVTDEVLAAFRTDQELAAGDRQKALQLAEEKVLPHVDFAEATRLAVGRSWNSATPEQRERLASEFRAMLVRTYSSAITAYRGQQMRVLPLRMKPGDTDVTVQNQFIRAGGGAPVRVDYSMRKTDAGWKIYDIVVEGVSLVLTYRSEFDVVARHDGVEGLIQRLATKNTPPNTPQGAGATK